MELNDRDLALRWWGRRTTQEKIILTNNKFSKIQLSQLTGLEIEIVWRKQQE